MAGNPTYATKHYMRGLAVFINSIRECNNKKEEEEKIILKEMAKIRKKLHEQKKSLDGYNRRKYVSKLLFMYLLGYEADFGYLEALGLLSSSKLPEKLVGYITLGVVLHEDSELLPKLQPALRADIQSGNEIFSSMALATIANIGGKVMAEALEGDIQQLFFGSPAPMVMKKCALTLLRIYRDKPFQITPEWESQFSSVLSSNDCGVLSSVMSLLIELCKNPQNRPILQSLQAKVVSTYNRVIKGNKYSVDYVYYKVPCPWLQVKFFKFIGMFPMNDIQLIAGLGEIIGDLINLTTEVRGQQKNYKNAHYVVLFEAINLAIKLNIGDGFLQSAVDLLGSLITDRNSVANHIYIIMDSMSQLARYNSRTVSLLKKHEKLIIQGLHTSDISISRRSLELLYGIADRDNSEAIVGELINHLQNLSNYIDDQYNIRGELVLKISILAEKYSRHYRWYVDVILRLITLAGDTISDVFWYRAIKIITNQVDIQEYATSVIFKALKHPAANACTIKFGSYILGEYGNLITHKPGMEAEKQFQVVQSKFRTSDNTTKAILLSTFLKFINLYPHLKSLIYPIFDKNQTVIDQEIQQRACEYAELIRLSDDKLLGVVCDVMPPYENFKADVPDLPIDDREEERLRTLEKTDSQESTTGEPLKPTKSVKPPLPPTPNTPPFNVTTSSSGNPPLPAVQPVGVSGVYNNTNSSDETSEIERRRELEMRENIRRQQEQIERDRIYAEQLQQQQHQQMYSQPKPAEIPRPAEKDDSADRRKEKELRKMQKKIQRKEDALRKEAEKVKNALVQVHEHKSIEQQQKENQLNQLAQVLMEKEKELLGIQEQLKNDAYKKEQELREKAKMAEKALINMTKEEKKKAEKQLLESTMATRSYLEEQQASWQRQQMMEYEYREKELREREMRLREQEEIIKRGLQQEEYIVRQKRDEEEKRRVQERYLENQRIEALRQEAERLQRITSTNEQDRLKRIEEERLQALANLKYLEQEQLRAVAAEKEKLSILALQYKKREDERVQALAQAEKEKISLLVVQEQERILLVAAEQQRLLEVEREKIKQQLLLQQQQVREEAEQLRLSLIKQQQEQQELLRKQQAEVLHQQHQTELLRQHQQAEIIRHQQSETLRLQQQAENLRQQQAAEIHRQQQAEAIRQQQAAEILRQQQAAEALRQQQAAEALRQQQQAAEVLRQQQAAAEILRQQQAAEALRQQQQAEALRQQQQAAAQAMLAAVASSSQIVQFQPERATNVSTHTLTAEERSTKAIRKLTIINTGIIYEDDQLQIGLQSEYQRGEGRIELYFTNKTIFPINSLRFSMLPVSYVTCRTTNPPPTIPPQNQAKLQLSFTCELPFESYPESQISYLIDGKSKILKLKIPLAITKFCDPVPLDGNTWYQRWQQINGKPLEIQEMFAAITTTVAHIQELLSKGFRFAFITGIDNSPLNIIGSSVFHTSQGDFPCFVRLETNPGAQMIRMTIKSSNGQLTSALRNIFILHLATENQQQTQPY